MDVRTVALAPIPGGLMATTSGHGDLSWFRRPSTDGTDPGTLNPVFQLLDLAVIRGRSDEPVLLDGSTPISHVTLLEEVAGLGGVLRGLGVGPGTPVACLLEPDRRGVTTLLALARLGAVLDDEAELVVSHEGVADVGWDLVRPAGRADPAPAAELTPDAPWTARRTSHDLAHDLRLTPTPSTPADLSAVLRG